MAVCFKLIDRACALYMGGVRPYLDAIEGGLGYKLCPVRVP